MNKNLKKVISAVIALSVSVTSVALAASKGFTDVAATASYAEAVNTLTALGVIAGYEDGTFKPDNNITRAEVSTMVVAALNRSGDAAGAKGTTKFADVNVTEKEWASGYVNIGVSEGFISGYEDKTFKPDNNVTYAEIVSMLVRVAGYGRYAEYLGGWPNGYLSVGNDKGVTKNVSAGQDTPVTRAQVAQLIYNTLLNVPIVESTTLTTDSNGNLVPEMTIMDGKNGNDYKTLLTQKHNAYYVEGYVSNTNRTNSDTIDADEVEFTIEYTENYDDGDTVVKKGTTPQKEVVYVGNTDAANNLFTYASAIVKIDEDGDATLVSFVPSGKNQVNKFDASLLDATDYNLTGSNPYLKFYATKDASKSTKYSLDKSEVRLFVNGVEIKNFDDTDFSDYVLKNESGSVELIDQYTVNSKADGLYDIISVTYYGTGKVSAVNQTTGKISFEDYYHLSNIVLDPDDEDLVYHIYYNGQEVALSSVQTGDVLSVAYNVNDGADQSSFYDIYVSRDTATGKYTGNNKDDKEAVIGGKNYEFVKTYAESITGLNLSDEYTLYLDAFGKIFSYELLTSSAKLAVVDKYTKSSSDDYYRALLYTTDGSSKSLEVDTTKVTSFNGNSTDVNQAIKDYVYATFDTNGNGVNKEDIEKRVVEYKISSSSGRIISLTPATSKPSGTDATFKSASNALGSIKLSDATKVIDAVKYNKQTTKNYTDLVLSSVAGFTDGDTYTAFAYGTRNNDGTYPLVLVTKGESSYNADTQLAVITKTPSQADKDGEDVYTVEALYGTETKTFYVNDDANVNVGGVSTDILTLSKGDIFAFSADNSGNITDLDVVASATKLGTSTDYNSVLTKALAGTDLINTLPASNINWSKKWSIDAARNELTAANKYRSNKDIVQFVYGPIVEKKTNYFQIGTVAQATSGSFKDNKDATVSYTGPYTDKSLEADGTNGGVLDVNITSATRVYVMDYTKSNPKSQLYVGSIGDIANTQIADSELYNTQDVIPWNNIKGSDAVNFAFAKVVDGDATDVYVIIGNLN